MARISLLAAGFLLGCATLSGCNSADTSKAAAATDAKAMPADTAEYFSLRPKLEKEYGYSHAVRIGNRLKISGAVSMDDNGNIVALGNLE